MKNYYLKTIRELEGANKDNEFVVEKYQRGYRWGIREVEDLLEDIYQFKREEQAFYCLQPIVVKKTKPNTFELIDGQQRLTTTFLILKSLGSTLFSLTYNTRPKSATFIEKITDLQVLELKGSGMERRKSLNEAWSHYIARQRKNNNIDNYHFFSSYQIIQNWLINLDKEEKNLFKTNLCDYTKVIWYEIISTQTPEEIFINFNQGKIHLEQAELIKALFILHFKEVKNIEMQTLEINKFADEWNIIENKLQDDKFWFFVSNDISDNRRSNRIDLLFDIICERPKGEENKLFSYHKYLTKFNNKDLSHADWQRVKNLYYLLVEWYERREIYHLLGLLVYLDIKNISQVYEEYNKSEDKTKFESQLKLWISEVVQPEDPKSKYNLSRLSYESNSKKFTLKTLVVFNVAIAQISDFNYRFPFDKLKTQNWSLEHIHAQNSESFTIVKEVREWLEDISLLLDEMEESEKSDIQIETSSLEGEVQNNKDDDPISNTTKSNLKTLNNLLDDKLKRHSINNLCLLDGSTNSTVSNRNFRCKRKKLLEIDAKGEYEVNGKKFKTFIPTGTKNVFLKYYSKDSENIQFTYWGNSDRNNYELALEKTIKDYIN